MYDAASAKRLSPGLTARVGSAIGIVDSARRLGAWMRDDALPLWSEAGFCRADGGFYEAFDPDGAPLIGADRRVRVQFSQIYVFSRAYLSGWSDAGLDRAAAAFDYVAFNAWAPDGKPGWVGLLDADGLPLSLTREADDHAFALLALGWFYRASGDPRALSLLRRTQDVIDQQFAASTGGWFEIARGRDRMRRQTPHMNAFAAYLALYELLDDCVWLRRANRMLALFRSRFYDRDLGRVREFFSPKLQALDPIDQREEPGHGAEWAWLLSEHRRLTGAGDPTDSDALLRRALGVGLSYDAPFLLDGWSGTGAIYEATRRLWPQAALLRALAAAVRDYGDSRAAQTAQSVVDALFDSYLAAPVAGSWIDCFDANGRPVDRPAPASALHHMFGAVAALTELAELVSGAASGSLRRLSA